MGSVQIRCKNTSGVINLIGTTRLLLFRGFRDFKGLKIFTVLIMPVGIYASFIRSHKNDALCKLVNPYLFFKGLKLTLHLPRGHL